MPKTIRTADDVIKALGGPARAGQVLGISYEAVCNIRARGRLDPRHYFTVADALPNTSIDRSLFVRGERARV